MRKPLSAVAACMALAACGRSATPPAQTAEVSVPARDTVSVVTTPSGLKYQDLVLGTGAIAMSGSWVSVHYVGQLEDGTRFDVNGPNQAPLRFLLGARRVIAGWDEGISGMRVGGRRRLIIPPSLGYGNHASGPIPARSILIFLVELVEAN